MKHKVVIVGVFALLIGYLLAYAVPPSEVFNAVVSSSSATSPKNGVYQPPRNPTVIDTTIGDIQKSPTKFIATVDNPVTVRLKVIIKADTYSKIYTLEDEQGYQMRLAELLDKGRRSYTTFPEWVNKGSPVQFVYYEVVGSVDSSLVLHPKSITQL